MAYQCTPYDLTNTWTVTAIGAVVVPPVVAQLQRQQWRVSLRRVIVYAVVACTAVGFAGWDLWNMWRSGYTSNLIPENWLIPVCLLIISSLVTAVSTRDHLHEHASGCENGK